MDGKWEDGWMGGWVDRRMSGLNGSMDGWVGRRMDG